MKVLPINNANKITFAGLWEKAQEEFVGFKNNTVQKRIKNNYHPFADETGWDIQHSLNKKNYHILKPANDDRYMIRIVSETKMPDKLSFSKKEFTAYKNFYGKNLPEYMKKIEQELVEKNLSHYLNNKTLSAIKRFLHNIRII